MPPEPLDPALNLFAVGTLLLSIVACMNVIQMRRQGSVLPYESRRPVPWGPVGCVLAMTYLLFTAISAFGRDGDGPSQPLTPSTLIAGMLQQFFIVGGFVFVIAMFTKATQRDLGLPANRNQWIRDVCVGGAACLAALAPVILLQELLMHVFFPNQMSGHPLIKMVTDAPPDPWILLLTGVVAVVVAPICEEIAFRLLLQGWLERWEDEQLGWRRNATVEIPSQRSGTADDEASATNDEPVQAAIPSSDMSNLPIESDPPARGSSGLPYGWFPIVASATAFGVAHFGYGPEPVPLFLLGLVLGFLYQRTHRIIPGIVAHALFNLFTMIILWRMVYHHG
jgi:membrane protease YdiL (CAAX protease family)